MGSRWDGVRQKCTVSSVFTHNQGILTRPMYSHLVQNKQEKSSQPLHALSKWNTHCWLQLLTTSSQTLPSVIHLSLYLFSVQSWASWTGPACVRPAHCPSSVSECSSDFYWSSHDTNGPYNQIHQHVSFSNSSSHELLLRNETVTVRQFSQQLLAGGQKHCELDVNYKWRHLKVSSSQLGVQ